MAQTEDRRRAVWQRVRRALAGHVSTKVLVGGLAVAAVLVWLAVLAAPDGRLHVTFLDVGQGDAVLVETPSGRQIVVNGGPSGTAMAAHLGRRMPFWDRGLDGIIMTDLRDEHVAGLVPVVKRYDVAFLWEPPSEGDASSVYEAFRATAQEKGFDGLAPVAGTTADLGDGVILRILVAEKEMIALRVDYGQTCFLLASSADLEAERALLGRGERVRCDILQVGVHGSTRATGPRFLEAVRPALAVISVGEGNRAGGPDQAVLARLAEHGATVVRTDELGSVEVISDGVGYQVRVGR